MNAATQSTSQQEWRPSASLDLLRARGQLYQLIRSFFADRSVMEVSTPMLGSADIADPELEAMRFSMGSARGWLRTSPEAAHKRLLAADAGAIYELGRCFRANESGRFHNPEFTMLEWYQPGYTRARLIDETVELIECALLAQSKKITRLDVRYADAFEAGVGVNFETHESVSNLATSHGAPTDLDRSAALDFLFSELVCREWPDDRLTVVTDFPADRPAMSEVQGNVADRFEVFIGSVELANGYQELTDADELEQRWRSDGAKHTDQRLLRAMRHGLPKTAGVAVGVDRLLMVINGCDHIDDVIAFPIGRT